MNIWPKDPKNVNAAIIVAHPDDETIFCGGTLLSYPLWNWSVICVTAENDERFNEFEKAIEIYKCLGVNITRSCNLKKPDKNEPLSEEDRQNWKESIEQLGLSPEIVFTHHKTGDYHVNHHIPLAKIVFELFSGICSVWETVYPGNPDPHGINEYARGSKCHKVELTQDLLKQKKEIFDTSYVNQIERGINTNNIPGIIEYEFIKGPEMFTSD